MTVILLLLVISASNLNRNIKTAEQWTPYNNTVIGTLAVDGWDVTCGTARRGLGGAIARSSPSSLYQM